MYSEESAVTWQWKWGTENALDKCFPPGFLMPLSMQAALFVGNCCKRNSECGW